jgi:CDP-diacylglycerol--glycerol-3-phosphate 3-phosphatidyltransferase
MNAKHSRIRALHRPHEFYDALVEAVERSTSRISLAALYLGTGEHERRLVASLAQVLRTRPNVTVQLCFDGRRAWRKSKDGVSTVSLLSPLLAEYGDRITLSLFTLPAAQRAAILPSPLDEVAGVFHMKTFCCDNQLIISGGNLSTEYFVDRQDRYVLFGEAGPLASFYHEFIGTMASCGESVSPGALGSSITKAPTRAELAEWRERLESCVVCNNPNKGEVMDSHKGEDTASLPVVDTWVYPTLQANPLGISQDLRVTEALLRSAPKHGSVNLATAYLNPSPSFTKLLAAASPEGTLRVLSSHADSHGFRSARGLMSIVPKCYEFISKRYFVPTLTSLRPWSAHVHFYQRKFWTYHAKGLWIWPAAAVASEEGKGSSSSAAVTVVGSSNYGRRSYNLDLESQLVCLARDFFKIDS